MFELVKFLAFDVIFMGLVAGGLVLLSIYSKPAFAVLKRNFVGYFSNPTGYVFLCLFVLLTSLAAFWPHDFFVSNLANLDQLNRWLPQIMLIFVPAITMSIWSEERRQGTDELLLTLPATDFDIVIGKYLAAALIFTCSLVFSQISSYIVLLTLAAGNVDTGLIFTTYLGYWCIGLTMLSIGMVASFLTKNLTVGFILGLIFNAPLAFASYLTGMVSNPDYTGWLTRWSLATQFDDFGRGVLSLASFSFFAMLTGIGLYVSMVMIGSRHWYGGRDGQSLLGHYLVRAAALVVTLVGLNLALTNYDPIRYDTTQGKVSSLSPQTRELIRKLDPKHTVVVDAFLSREVPEDYVKTKYTIVSMLKELQRLSNGKIVVKIRDNLEAFDDEATKAEEQFGIKSTPVRFASKGAIRDQDILLGAAFTSGLEKVVVPFFDYGIPVEYELVRSISTVARGERKRLGIVQTDARLNGGFDFAGGMPRQMPKQAIVEEFEKQYKVEEVDPAQPIDLSKYDVLLAVQPSSLGPQQLNHLVEAIRDGMPTAIFEDPMPRVIATTVGTLQPKPPQGGMFGGGGPPPPKGDMKALWGLLGIEAVGAEGAPPADKIVWQRYNPYPRLEQLTGLGPELVFIRNEIPESTNEPFNAKDSITSGLEEILFPFAGAIKSTGKGSSLQVTDLVTTGKDIVTGIAKVEDFMGRGGPLSAAERYGLPTKVPYTLAARISGELKTDKPGEKPEGEGDGPKKNDAKKDEGKATKIDVVYVTDIDMLDSQFVMFRNSRDRVNDEFNFRFDNVTFILNIIDSLAQDDRFIEIRKRKPKFSTLQLIEGTVAEAREEELKAVEGFQAEFKKAVEAEEEKAKKEYDELEKKWNELERRRADGEIVDPAERRVLQTRLDSIREAATRRLDVVRNRLKQENEKKQMAIRRETDRTIQGTQNYCKFLAVALPSVPPLLIGLLVFLYRRLREREGISRTRRR